MVILTPLKPIICMVGMYMHVQTKAGVAYQFPDTSVQKSDIFKIATSNHMGAASPKSGGHEFWPSLPLSPTESFPTSDPHN